MSKISYSFEYAYGKPEIDAELKVEPEDFKVTEELGFEFSGEGEHVCLRVEKTGLNTNDALKTLSRYFHVSQRDISYAGLKDRQAVTQQWFSFRVGIKKELAFSEFSHPAITILEASRNSRKIKRGSHRGNRFSIRLKGLKGDLSSLNEKVRLIQARGVPNYFGAQRFGKGLDNVDQALRMFKGEINIKDRFLRGIYLSAARSWLFNRLLATRVEQDNWDSYLSGDVMSLDGTNSKFVPKEWNDELEQRLESGDIHSSGALWGEGDLQSSAQVRELEDKLSRSYPDLCKGLVDFGLKQERRALRLRPQDLQIYPEASGHLVVEFGLGRGAYATSVLRELANISKQ